MGLIHVPKSEFNHDDHLSSSTLPYDIYLLFFFSLRFRFAKI